MLVKLTTGDYDEFRVVALLEQPDGETLRNLVEDLAAYAAGLGWDGTASIEQVGAYLEGLDYVAQETVDLHVDSGFIEIDARRSSEEDPTVVWRRQRVEFAQSPGVLPREFAGKREQAEGFHPGSVVEVRD